MKIVFSTDNTNHLFGGDIENEKLGGAWFVHLNIAKQLAKYGHRVYCFQHCKNEDPSGEVFHNFKVVHRKWLKDFLKKSSVDIFVGERDLPFDRHDYKINKVLYHSHNTPDAVHSNKLRSLLSNELIDKIIFVSKWHSDIAKGIPEKYKCIIPNGTDLYDITFEKKYNRIIWASNATRGLHFLATEIFPEVLKINPDMELHVAGGHNIYNCSKANADKKNAQSYACLYEDRFGGKLKKNHFYYGALNQRDLAKFYKEGTVLVYPLTNMSETGSIVTVQSLANGTPAIVRNRCVLPELVGDDERGFRIDHMNPEVWADFICKFVEIKAYNFISKKCIEWGKKYTWDYIGKIANDIFEGCK